MNYLKNLTGAPRLNSVAGVLAAFVLVVVVLYVGSQWHPFRRLVGLPKAGRFSDEPPGSHGHPGA